MEYLLFLAGCFVGLGISQMIFATKMALYYKENGRRNEND